MIREAQERDAASMSDVLQELIAVGKRTNSAKVEFVLSHYLNHPARLHCAVATDNESTVLGFQSLKIAGKENPYGTPIGWGIIGTHVRPVAARHGVASRLFGFILKGAREANLLAIEAHIGRTNDTALAYYDRIGFQTYRETDKVICKAFALAQESRLR